MMVQPHCQPADAAQLCVLPAHLSRKYLIFDVIGRTANSRRGFVELGHLRLEQMDDELGSAIEVAAIVDLRA